MDGRTCFELLIKHELMKCVALRLACHLLVGVEKDSPRSLRSFAAGFHVGVD
jgi:hypothetical protein